MKRPYRCNRLPGVTSAPPRSITISAIIESSIAKPRSELTDFAAVGQLAEDMRTAYQREGGISRDELRGLGWTDAQLDNLAERARSRAQQLAGAGV
jgi:hypothetical protein